MNLSQLTNCKPPKTDQSDFDSIRQHGIEKLKQGYTVFAIFSEPVQIKLGNMIVYSEIWKISSHTCIYSKLEF